MGTKGFTLIEILVALAIVAVLSALALPAVWGRLGDARLNAGARQIEAAVISVRTQAQRDGSAVVLMAEPGRHGMRLVAERVQLNGGLPVGVSEDGELGLFDNGGSEQAMAAEGRPQGRRVIGTLPRGVLVGFALRAGEDQVARGAQGNDEVTVGEVPPVRVVVALPDGTMVSRGPVELVAGGAGLRMRINRFTGICTVERGRAMAREAVGVDEGFEERGDRGVR